MRTCTACCTCYPPNNEITPFGHLPLNFTADSVCPFTETDDRARRNGQFTCRTFHTSFGIRLPLDFHPILLLSSFPSIKHLVVHHTTISSCKFKTEKYFFLRVPSRRAKKLKKTFCQSPFFSVPNLHVPSRLRKLNRQSGLPARFAIVGDSDVAMSATGDFLHYPTYDRLSLPP